MMLNVFIFAFKTLLELTLGIQKILNAAELLHFALILGGIFLR
jgi:hypothetical protein